LERCCPVFPSCPLTITSVGANVVQTANERYECNHATRVDLRDDAVVVRIGHPDFSAEPIEFSDHHPAVIAFYRRYVNALTLIGERPVPGPQHEPRDPR